MWKHKSDAAKSKAKLKRAILKPMLDNARKLRGILFIELEDEEFKHILINARIKLEMPMPTAMPCKTPTNCHGETCRDIGKHKTKYACIVDADESVRKRMQGTHREGLEDHIAGRGINSLNNHNLVHKVIPVLQAMKIPDAKAAVEKMEKLETILAWQLTKVRNEKR